MSLQYRLENFEGPLDLLLSLVTSAKIEIKDIFISEITEQYLSLMDQAESLDMDTASEFLQLASDLLYIKSRSLLPKKVPEDDLDEEGLTPEERLTKRLEEYRVYKEVSEKLRDFEKQGLLYRYKLPEEILPDPDQEPEFFVDAQLIMN
ncbi:MAG: segregation/condensation protein A, partial [Christensenellaceae bacterium]|nr:segregation/condensation protein A [Christensenellaceae bacterium]